MRKEKMSVRLVTSKRMDEAKGVKEHSYIRVPKRARTNFNTKGERLRLIVNKKEVVLNIKQAYKNDVSSLIKQFNSGEIDEIEARMTGFLTAKTYDSLVGKHKEDLDKFCFLSDSIEDIKLGADPEFALVSPQSKRFKYAKYVHDLSENGQLGSDGPVAEVRPPPSTNVNDVITSIKNILLCDCSSIIKYDWVAGATYKCPDHPSGRTLHMGGHIHLGNTVLLDEALKVAIYERIIRVLDETVALPLVRIDGPLAHERRNKTYQKYGRYGRWGDQRPQPDRFEWRVPSGLWLAHPNLALAVLGTTKALTETCLQMMAEEGFDSAWVNAPANKKGFLKTWGTMNARKAASLINKSDPKQVPDGLITRAKTKLLEMSNYHKYRAEVDEFVSLVQLKNPKFNLDIKSTWLNGGKMFLEEGKHNA